MTRRILCLFPVLFVLSCTQTKHQNNPPLNDKTASLTSIAIAPTTSLLPNYSVGSTEQFSATGTYSDGTTKDLTSEVTWVASTSDVSISPAGLATVQAVTGATCAISVSAPLPSNSITLSLSNSTGSLVSVTILPAAALQKSYAVGSTEQFTATGDFTDGHSQDFTSIVTWASSYSGVTISASGLATVNATSSASTIISATLPGSSLGINSIVMPLTSSGGPILTSITIAATPSLLQSYSVGSTQQFQATAQFSDGSSADYTSKVTWTTSDKGVVISASGLATVQAVDVSSVQINASYSAGNGISANTITMNLTTTTVLPPTAPTALVVSSDSTNPQSALDLTWANTASNATTLTVQRSTDDKTFNPVTSGPCSGLSVSAASCIDSGLLPSTTYYYKVVASNSAGSAASVVSSAMTMPSVPTGLKGSGTSINSITLTWTNTDANQSGVYIERALESTSFITNWIQIGSASSTATSYTDNLLGQPGSSFQPALAPATQYFYRVRSYDSKNNSVYSNAISASTLVPSDFGCQTNSGDAALIAAAEKLLPPVFSQTGTPQNYTLCYLDYLYKTVLGRTPAPSEIANWATGLFSGPTYDAHSLAMAFLTSTERRTDDLVAYYELLLRRYPDKAGLNTWLTSGKDPATIMAGFAGSAEFTGDSFNKPFNNAVASDFLGRAAPASIDTWSAISDPTKATLALLNTDYANNTSEIIGPVPDYRTIDITNDYQLFLGRAPDTAGLYGWWKNTSLSLYQIKADFAASMEALERAGATSTYWLPPGCSPGYPKLSSTTVPPGGSITVDFTGGVFNPTTTYQVSLNGGAFTSSTSPQVSVTGFNTGANTLSFQVAGPGGTTSCGTVTINGAALYRCALQYTNFTMYPNAGGDWQISNPTNLSIYSNENMWAFIDRGYGVYSSALSPPDNSVFAAPNGTGVREAQAIVYATSADDAFAKSQSVCGGGWGPHDPFGAHVGYDPTYYWWERILPNYIAQGYNTICEQDSGTLPYNVYTAPWFNSTGTALAGPDPYCVCDTGSSAGHGACAQSFY